jgi:xylulokinase
LGFDLGTQGAKGIITDFSGNTIAHYYSSHEVESPEPTWAEHNAEEIWWNGFIKVVKGLLEKSGINSSDIAAIGCSTITPCMLPIDEFGKPLRNGILYGIDSRSSDEADELSDLLDSKYKELRVSLPLSVQSIGSRILWYKRNEPALFNRTVKYATASTWLTYCLTGEFVVSKNEIFGYSPMYDHLRDDWNDRICEEIGITREKLPTIVPDYHIVGTVSKRASKATGLKEGTPVTAAVGDYAAEILSAGANDGETILLYGSTMIISSVTSKPVNKDDVYYSGSLMPGLYTTGGSTATAASITKWFRDQFGYEETRGEKEFGIDAYSALSDLVSDIPVGSDGLILLPYFAGERSPFQNPFAKGMLFGLSLYHTKAHVYKAVLEGVAYSFYHNIETMRQAGLTITSTLSAGGGIKSANWVQIMSDVAGVSQRCLHGNYGAPGGCAYMAGYGIGVYKNTDVIREKSIQNSKIVEPNMKNHEKYQQYYRIYRKLYENTKQLMSDISIVMK